MNRNIYRIDLFGAWLRSAGTLLRGYEHPDPARVRMLIDDAQYNSDIDPREVVEVVPLGIRVSGDLYGTMHAILTVYEAETGWSHAQAVSVGGDGAGELVCPACWPRRCDCDVDPSMPACPACKTNADVTDDTFADDADYPGAPRGDHECLACGDAFYAPRKTKPNVVVPS